MKTSFPAISPKQHYNYNKYILLNSNSKERMALQRGQGLFFARVNRQQDNSRSSPQHISIIVAKEGHSAQGQHFNDLVEKLKSLSSWEQVYSNVDLHPKVFTS